MTNGHPLTASTAYLTISLRTRQPMTND